MWILLTLICSLYTECSAPPIAVYSTEAECSQHAIDFKNIKDENTREAECFPRISTQLENK